MKTTLLTVLLAATALPAMANLALPPEIADRAVSAYEKPGMTVVVTDIECPRPKPNIAGSGGFVAVQLDNRTTTVIHGCASRMGLFSRGDINIAWVENQKRSTFPARKFMALPRGQAIASAPEGNAALVNTENWNARAQDAREAPGSYGEVK
jgi:hypothetical protein